MSGVQSTRTNTDAWVLQETHIDLKSVAREALGLWITNWSAQHTERRTIVFFIGEASLWSVRTGGVAIMLDLRKHQMGQRWHS